MDLQDLFSTAADDEALAESCAEFLEARIKIANENLSAVTNAISGVSYNEFEIKDTIITYGEVETGQRSVKLNMSNYLTWLRSYSGHSNEYEVQPGVIMDPVDINNQLAQASTAVTCAAEAIRASIRSFRDQTVDSASDLTNRLQLKFATLSDVAAQFGYLFMNCIGDARLTMRDKIETIMKFIGCGEQDMSGVGAVGGDFADITGANVWTAFGHEVSQAGDTVAQIINKSWAKIRNGIGKIAKSVFGGVIDKAKDLYLTAITFKDAFTISNSGLWFGFADYGTTYKIYTGTTTGYSYKTHNQGANLYTDYVTKEQYTIFEMGNMKLLFWRDPDMDKVMYMKILFAPIHPKFFQGLGDINIGYGSTIKDWVEFWRCYKNIESYGYDLDEDMANGIFWGKHVGSSYIEFIMNQLGYSSASYKTTWMVNYAYGENFPGGSEFAPTNPTNKWIAQYLTSSDSGSIIDLRADAIRSEPVFENGRFWDDFLYMLWSIAHNNIYYGVYYHSNYSPSGKCSVMTDGQLANFASNAFIGIAAAVAVAVGVRLVGALKRKIFTLSNVASTKAFDACSGTTVDYSLLNQAYVAQRKADLLANLQSALGGSIKTLVANAVVRPAQIVTNTVRTAVGNIKGDNSPMSIADTSNKTIQWIANRIG